MQKAGLAATILAIFCAEGVNIPHAFALADATFHYLGLTQPSALDAPPLPGTKHLSRMINQQDVGCETSLSLTPFLLQRKKSLGRHVGARPSRGTTSSSCPLPLTPRSLAEDFLC